MDMNGIENRKPNGSAPEDFMTTSMNGKEPAICSVKHRRQFAQRYVDTQSRIFGSVPNTTKTGIKTNPTRTVSHIVFGSSADPNREAARPLGNARNLQSSVSCLSIQSFGTSELESKSSTPRSADDQLTPGNDHTLKCMF